MNCKKIFLTIIAAILIIGTGGYTMAQNTLTKKEQDIALISSYTASGNQAALEKALNAGLDDNLTENEIKEILVQLYAYCGFPRSLNAIGTFMGVIDKRNGNYKTGAEGKPLSKDTDKLAYGTEVQTRLAGAPVQGGAMDFAPAIDLFLKEHLFADIFGRGILTEQEREIATIAALSSMKGTEPQLAAHINIGKNTGITQAQVDEILKLTSGGTFGRGKPNTAYAKYFKGQSYLKKLSGEQVGIANVTFEPACRNNWHIHHKGGQILIVTSGRGYYQEWGKPAVEIREGDVINIAPEVKHWHGAAPDSWFSHIAVEVPSDGGSTEWLEAVDDNEYNKLK